MAPEYSKRKYSDYNAGGDAGFDGGEEPEYESRPFKKNKSKKGKSGSDSQPTTLNATKKRLRAVKRLISSGQSLPQNVQNNLERELEHLEHKVVELADEKLRKSMITKYHMVRFFERKKADRLAKQLKTQLKAATEKEDNEKIAAKLHIAEIDSLYARNFPHRERYISLYTVATEGDAENGAGKKKDSGSAAKFLDTPRPAIWTEIEAASTKGEKALASIRERRTVSEATGANTTGSTQASTRNKAPVDNKSDTRYKSTPKTERVIENKRKSNSVSEQPVGPVAGNRRARRQAERERQKLGADKSAGSGDESDGGFFDEA